MNSIEKLVSVAVGLVCLMCGLSACAGNTTKAQPGERIEAGPFAGLGQQEIEQVLNFLRLDSPYVIATLRDEAHQASVNRLKYNRLSGPKDRDNPQEYHGVTLAWTLATAHLAAEQVLYDNGSVEYYLTLLYRGEEWLSIPDGPSLSLLLDGTPIRFSGEGSKEHRVVPAAYFGKAEEMARYRVEYADLKRIGAAGAVKVEWRGNAGILQRACSLQNLAYLTRFANEHPVPEELPQQRPVAGTAGMTAAAEAR